MSPRRPNVSVEGLSVGEAFAAMSLFIDQFARRAGDDLLTLIGDISLMPDDSVRRGTTTDPAAWDDCLACVAEVKERGLSGPVLHWDAP